MTVYRLKILFNHLTAKGYFHTVPLCANAFWDTQKSEHTTHIPKLYVNKLLAYERNRPTWKSVIISKELHFAHIVDIDIVSQTLKSFSTLSSKSRISDEISTVRRHFEYGYQMYVQHLQSMLKMFYN